MNGDRFLSARYWISGVAAFVVLGVLFLYNLSPVAHIEMSAKVRSMVRPVLVAYYWNIVFGGGGWYYSVDEQELVLAQCGLSDRLVFFQTIIASCEMEKNATIPVIFYELINGDAAALAAHLDAFMQTSEFSRLTQTQQARIRWHAAEVKWYGDYLNQR